jgi:hypothetical protein
MLLELLRLQWYHSKSTSGTWNNKSSKTRKIVINNPHGKRDFLYPLVAKTCDEGGKSFTFKFITYIHKYSILLSFMTSMYRTETRLWIVDIL